MEESKVRITGLSESTVRRRRRRRRGRHHGRLRTAREMWHLTRSKWRDALVILTIMALAAAGGVGIAMFTYDAWP